tara:strand:- start:94 stop:423 length:330 start_codon:yes stop_codon:yes gene_type:complete
MNMAKITIVYWRDIPAQIIAEQGRGRNRKQFKIELGKKFIVSIDSAAMKSGAEGSDDYLSDWRRSDPEEISDNLELEVNKLKKEIEEKYSNSKLKELISNGGFKEIKSI